MPRTAMIPLRAQPKGMCKIADGDLGPMRMEMPAVKKICNMFGYPVFMRSDQASAKHDWKDTCYLENEQQLGSHITNIMDFNIMNDLFPQAIVIRDYIPMDTLFTAFDKGMPINPEFRFFVRDHNVVGYGWYWCERAIYEGTRSGLPRYWKHKLKKARESIGRVEINKLIRYAQLIANRVDGYWSVDFCRGKDKVWYMIDMAIGKASWMPEDYKEIDNRRIKNEPGNRK